MMELRIEGDGDGEEIIQLSMNGFSVMEDEDGTQTVVHFSQQTDHAQQDSIAYFADMMMKGQTAREIIASHEAAIKGFVEQGFGAATTKGFSLVENRQSPDPLQRWESRVTERNEKGTRSSIGYSDTPAGAAAFAMMTVISYYDFATWIEKAQPDTNFGDLSDEDQAFAIQAFWQSQGRADEEPGLTKGN